MKPGINIQAPASQLADEEKVEKLLEANISVWVLRWKKQTWQDPKIFGVENIEIVAVDNINENTVDFVKKPGIHSILRFVSEQKSGVATAYMADTNKNRNILASHFFAGPFDIVQKLTPDGVLNAVTSKNEIKALAQKQGFKKPVTRDAGMAQAMLARRTRIDREMAIKRGEASPGTTGRPSEPPAQAPPETPPPPPGPGQAGPPPTPPEKPAGAPLSKEEVLAAVLEQNNLLVNHLKKKKGDKWNTCKEYKDIILAEVDRIFAEAEKATAEKAEEEAGEGEGAGAGAGAPAGTDGQGGDGDGLVNN